MTSRGYTVLGWITWQVAKRVAKRKMGQNKAKIGGAATAALVLVAGLVAAKASIGGDDGD
jgi:hypothetical protein